MVVLIKAAQLILSLSILIIIHEMGHFLFAKAFKTRVEKFFLFFDIGFSLFKFKKGETLYGMGWLPLGGYVKISGMIDESMDKEQMKQPPQPWEFRSKPAGQRLLIMVGGVLMNFLAAMIIYIGVLYAWGEEYLPNKNVKYGISVSETAKEIGFMPGDKILSVDNLEVEDFQEILSTIVFNSVKSVQVEREGEKIDIQITKEHIAKLLKNNSKKPVQHIGIRYPFGLEVVDFIKNSPAEKAGLKKGDQVVKVNGVDFEFHDQYTDLIKGSAGTELIFTVKRDTALIDFPIIPNKEGMIGIQMKNTSIVGFEYKTLKYGFFESIPAGVAKGMGTVSDYIKQFKLIFDKETKGYESLGGFMMIGSIFPSEWNWKVFWNMTAFLSIILAIMNILPIPALDGGHVMFVLYEIVTGRKPNDKFLEYAQYVGLSILILLLLYANGNDVVRFFFK